MNDSAFFHPSDVCFSNRHMSTMSIGTSSLIPSGPISSHILWTSNEGPISVPVAVWFPVSPLGSPRGNSHGFKDVREAEEEEAHQIQGRLPWYVEVNHAFSSNYFIWYLSLIPHILHFRRRFPSPESEPCLKDKASSTFPNLSRLRSAIRM